MAYSYPKITPGYLPPAKVAVSAPAYLGTPAYSTAYSTAPIVTKYAASPAIATSGYNSYGSYGSYGSVYDSSYSKGASYYSAPKVLTAPVTKYVSAPAVATTYSAGPTIAPVTCKKFHCFFLFFLFWCLKFPLYMSSSYKMNLLTNGFTSFFF